MRGKSHAALGQLLLQEYMPDIPRKYSRAFLIGCIQPDRNPATYLKGSIRSRWMRGHNYSNSSRFLLRLAVRLERRGVATLWDYYSLGKLVHYTMDAFTFPHNEHFDKGLTAHRQYEIQLQIFFLRHLHSCQIPDAFPPGSCTGVIRKMHGQYMHLPGCVETDTAYAFSACCLLVGKLTENISERQKYQFPFAQANAIIGITK